nr:hypothetical protein [Tanacetum cinerariifolium]
QVVSTASWHNSSQSGDDTISV